MKNLSLAVATLLSISSISTLSAEQTLPNGWTLEGNWRTAYISDDGDSYEKEVHDFATGGWITLMTPEVKTFKAGITLLTAQPLLGQNKNGWLTDNKEGQEFTSFSYISEAYLTGTVFGNTSVILGRKVIDTPFANPDDIGMAPNSFEVYLVQSKDIENVTLTAGRVTKMAGHDAPSKGEFQDLTKGDGVSVVALNYSNEKQGLDAQAWYYNLNNVADPVDLGIVYGDFSYGKELSDKMKLTVGGQFAQYKQKDGASDDGSVVGAKADLEIADGTLGVAYNGADGDIAPNNGFGGGPFYTSSDILTIVSTDKKSSALQFSAGYNLNEKTSLTSRFTTFTPDKGDDLTELDVLLSYAHNDNLSLDVYFESYKVYQDDTKVGTDNNTEYSLFVNYKF